jgi:hypothetical protein
MKIITARGKRWVGDKAVVVTILRVGVHDGYRVHHDGKPSHSNWNCIFGDAAGVGKETRSGGALKEAVWQYAQSVFVQI